MRHWRRQLVWQSLLSKQTWLRSHPKWTDRGQLRDFIKDRMYIEWLSWLACCGTLFLLRWCPCCYGGFGEIHFRSTRKIEDSLRRDALLLNWTVAFRTRWTPAVAKWSIKKEWYTSTDTHFLPNMTRQRKRYHTTVIHEISISSWKKSQFLHSKWKSFSIVLLLLPFQHVEHHKHYGRAVKK